MKTGRISKRLLLILISTVFLFTLITALVTSTIAADLSTAKPEEVGLSTERLARIKPVMQRYVDQNLVPGTVTLVARKGKVVHLEAVGYRDVANKTEMKTDTIFRIASMTKPITSVALMMLYEEGHFLLSDPIYKWLPEFKNPKVAVPNDGEDKAEKRYKLIPARRQITIEHLLTHTAGLANNYVGKYTIRMYKKMEKTRKPEDDIEIYSKRYAELPLNYHPGEEWQYSGATTIVGRLVEVMSGMTLDEFFKKRIFQPLGMKDTHFYLPESKLDRFVVAYKPSQDKKNIEMIDPASSESRFVKPPHVFFRGSGGLVSTASDYFLFCQMMLNGGELNGTRILGRKTVEFMTQNHIGDLVPWLTGEGSGFGLGFSVQMNADHTNILTPSYWQKIPVIGSVGSYGWGGAYCTIFRIDPAEELIIIMMSQVRPYTHLNIRSSSFVLTYQAIID